MKDAQSVIVTSPLKANRVGLSKTRWALHKRGVTRPARRFFPSNATESTFAAFNIPGISPLIKGCLYYGHCTTRRLMGEWMTNPSFRERFHQSEGKTALISSIIAASIEAKDIKPDEKAEGSREFARYLPFWAGNLI